MDFKKFGFHYISLYLASALWLSWMTACSPVPEIEIPAQREYRQELAFSGEQALALEHDFVTCFPNRDSGQPNNQRAAHWIADNLSSLGLSCQIDEWEITNYSQQVKLQNVVCRLAGESPRQIVILAHHDQSPDTIQGADNDGSGIAILLHLARIFAAEGVPPYTLVFVSTDAEEYGMVGSRRFIQTHPDSGSIIAGISLDNLGKQWYNHVSMETIGQFRGVGPHWLQRMAQEAARAAGEQPPTIPAWFMQLATQMIPISFMDQGPLVAADVPALGFTGKVDPADDHAESQRWRTFHTPEDRAEYQSTSVLQRSGRTAEALIRELLARNETLIPQERGPYLYFEGSGQVLRDLPLWVIFISFAGLFFYGAYAKSRGFAGYVWKAWREALPHFLGLWLPLLLSILLTYLMIAVGLMDKYHLYPATQKDEPIYEPRWLAVGIFLVGLVFFLSLGRKLVRRYSGQPPVATRINSLAFLVIGLGAVYILAVNPFSLGLLMTVPAWLGIQGNGGRKWDRLRDLLFFFIGWLVVGVLLYQFGFEVLRNDFAILWYLLMMFSIRMIGFPAAVVITAIVGAGLSMIVPPPRKQNPPGEDQSAMVPAR